LLVDRSHDELAEAPAEAAVATAVL